MVTVAQLYSELRLGSESDTIPTDVSNILTRLIAVATARADKFAGSETPDAIKRHAIVLMASYLYEANPMGPPPSNSFRRSGAYDVLWPWRTHNLGIIDRDEEE